MKKNVKFDKNSLLYVIGTTILLSVIALASSVTFGLTSYNKLAQIQKDDALVSQKVTDYTVYGMSKEQKTDYEKLDSVDGISTYTEYDAKFTFKETSISDMNLILFENFDNLAYTPYRDDRVIEKSKQTYERNAYFSYDFAKANGIKLDDEIEIPFKNGPLKLNVSGIFESNYINGDNSFVISYTENKEFLDTNLPSISFQLSYVRVNDSASFEEYYKNNYKPLGLLKDKSEFENNIEYERYLEKFNSTDYNTKSYINKFVVEYKSNVDELKSSLNTSVIIFTVVSTLLVLLVGLLGGILFNKKVKTIRLFTNKGTPYVAASYTMGGINILLNVLVYLLVPIFIIKSNISYVSYSLYFSYVLPIFITALVAIIVVTFVNILVTAKIMRVKKIELKKAEEEKKKIEKQEADKKSK